MLVIRNVSAWPQKRPKVVMFCVLCLLVLLAPLAAGCSPQGLAQAATATAGAAQPEASPTGAATPASTVTEVPGTTGTPEGTPTPRPTPGGPTPADPTNLLNIFSLFPSTQNLVKRDALQLDGDDLSEVLFTVSEPGETVTNEVYSALRVLDYDPTYREWQVISLSDVITGTASPLPAFDRTDPNRANAFNGADLLKTGGTVFLARTTTVDGRAHLYMWAWDRDKREAAPIKMAGPDGVERDLDISGDLDVKVADLDNDLLYEVVADNLAGVEVWSWDGTKYVLKGGR